MEFRLKRHSFTKRPQCYRWINGTEKTIQEIYEYYVDHYDITNYSIWINHEAINEEHGWCIIVEYINK